MTKKTSKRGKPCPICSEAVSLRYKPFCSGRCRMRDLACWIGGDEPYVIAGPSMAPEGMEMSEEELAILTEELGEDVLPGGNVVCADFRQRKRRSDDESDGEDDR